MVSPKLGLLEVNMLMRMPVLDVRQLDERCVKLLADLFDKLERKAREIGGANRKEQVEQLKPIIREIDEVVLECLGLSSTLATAIENMVDILVERRISGAREAKPEAVKGTDEPLARAEKKRRRKRRKKSSQGSEGSKSLTEFMES